MNSNNIKTLLSAMMLAPILPAGAQAVTEISTDFTFGIPAAFTLYDNDGIEPSADVKHMGFEVGTPWVAYQLNTENNAVAASTSWYATSGTSDDWMVLPLLSVDSEQAVVRWRAKASDSMFSDGYAVYVSTSGNAIADFDKANPLFSVAAENGEWTEHTASLADFMGQDIYIAFVNNSTDKSCLYIDDIYAGEQMSFDITVNLPHIEQPDSVMTVSGTITSNLDEDVNDITIGYTRNGQAPVTQSLSIALQKGESTDFAFDKEEILAANETATFEVFTVCNGDTARISHDVTAFYHKVVTEEGTGTWCGYCVQGIAAIEDMNEKYPNNFIAISLHYNDPMEEPNYDDAYKSANAVTGYPSSIVNRRTSLCGAPVDIENAFNTLMKSGMNAGVRLSAEYNATTDRIELTTGVMFENNFTNAGYRLVYVLTENNVHVPDDDGYAQHNYYSAEAGYGLGEMGGFENLPPLIPASDMYFQEVARAAFDSYYGVEGSIPEKITGGEWIEHEYSFSFPDNVINRMETEIIAFIIDTRSNFIVNADRVNLGKVLSSVESATTNDNSINVYADGNRITVCGRNLGDVAVYTIDGRLVQRSTSGGDTCELTVDGQGMYIVRAAADGAVQTRKVTVK